MKKIMKISTKVFLILILFVMVFYTFNNSFVYAADTDFNPGDWDPGLKYNESGSKIIRSLEGESKLKEIANKIITPIGVIGSLVSGLAIIIIGIKYMLGSVEEKAEYKKSLGPYFIGAVFVFGITTVVSVIYNIASSFN